MFDDTKQLMVMSTPLIDQEKKEKELLDSRSLEDLSIKNLKSPRNLGLSLELKCFQVKS